MIPDQPSRQEIEVRLTALLLGELPEDEAKLLRWTIAQDAGLKKLHDQLKLTIGLVREATVHPAEPDALALSAARRRLLHAHFKTPRPKPLSWLRRFEMPPLVTALAVLAIVAVLAAMLLPSLAAAKRKSQKVSAANVLRQKALETQLAVNENPPASLPAVLPEGLPARSPVVPTLSPEPKLAPPPVQIVLPQTESAAPALAQNETPAGSDKSSVYSQRFIGRFVYSGEPATVVQTPAPATPSITSPEAGAVGTVNVFAVPGGGGGGGATTGPQFALNDSRFQPRSGGRLAGENGAVGGTFNFQAGASASAPSAALPMGQFPGNAGNLVAHSSAGQSAGNGFGIGNDGSDFQDKRALSSQPAARERFYRNPVSTDATGKAPVLGDVPMVGVLSAAGQMAASAPNAITPPAPSSNGPLALNGVNTWSGAVTANGGSPAFQDLQTNSVGTSRDQNVYSFNLNNSGLRQVAGALQNIFASDTSPSSQGSTLQQRALNTDTFSTGATLNNVNGAGLLPGSPVPPEAAAASSTRSADASAIALDTTLERQKDAKAEPSAYNDEKRELAQLKDLHKLLASKIEADKLDAEIPKTSMVQITDAAEPSKNRSLWQSLNGEYESKARIKVENDVNDTAGGSTITASAMSYDPYFIQTTFEVIQSDAVLGKAVDALKLQDVWAGNNGGEKLTKSEAIARLKSQLELKPVRNTKLIEIGATSDNPQQAAQIANAVSKAYQEYRTQNARQLAATGLAVLQQQYANEGTQISDLQAKVKSLEPKTVVAQADQPLPKSPANAPVPQPEFLTRENAFSTFSMNVSDVSFKLAEASLQHGRLPDAASIRSEEFINAFDYRDPEAPAGVAVAFTSERARDPFAHNRDLLRFSLKTAAVGRAAGRPLNLVLLLDNSGSMERADRVAIIRAALRVLAGQLHPQDTVSVVTFARTARLWVDGVPGNQAGAVFDEVGGLTPQGGTNLEEAMRLAYETARRHYLANGMNRVVLLTDGAANLGNVDHGALKQKVDANRRQGIALDCFGIGWEDYNDDLLELLSSNGDGRYAFLNSPDGVTNEFAAKLAGTLQVAAEDVKVQVDFNAQRVTAWRQIGYATHQLTQEQFRDNTVAAGAIAAQEAGNALYTVQVNPQGDGPLATVRVRYKIPGTTDVREQAWEVPYTGGAASLAQSSAALRLAVTAGEFAEWLAASPYAQEVTPDALLQTISGVPQIYGADPRPKQLEWMVRQAQSLSGK